MNTKEVLIVKYGEIALRGRNRYIYENMLMDAIGKNLKGHGEFKLHKEQGRFVIERLGGAFGVTGGAFGGAIGSAGDISRDTGDVRGIADIIPLVVCIFGITAVVVAVQLVSQDFDIIKGAALDYAKEHCKTPCSFRVTAKRANKQYPLRSDEVAAGIGEYLLDRQPGLKVDLTSPDFNLMIEIRNFVYIYSHDAQVKGLGGLPPGSAGRGVLLLSGGIDSPVAGYLAAKRGVAIDFVYFHSPPYTSERARQKVMDLADCLSRYVGRMRLIIINFTQLQLMLNEKTPPEKITIMLKRTMLKTADSIAKSRGALALFTGDSIGQVASQTMHSLHAMTGASQLPIIRPLACYDKQEIIDIAKRIGTFDISIRPYDDCCTLFLPKHPETKPKLSIIQSIEEGIEDLGALIDDAIENAEIIDL